MAYQNQVNCFVCDTRSRPARMSHLLHGEEHLEKCQIAISRRDARGGPPLIIGEETRICLNCNRSIMNEIRDLTIDPTCIRLNVLTQTSSHTCFICNAAADQQTLSNKCRANVFVHRNIFIPDNVKACRHHLDDNGFILPFLLPGIQFVNRPYVIKGQQLSIFLQGLRFVAIEHSSYEDENNFSEDEFQAISPITKEQFRSLFMFCDMVPQEHGYRYITKKDLMTFLCKLRQGLSDDFLKVIFHYPSRQATSLAISKVRQSLMQRFVPSNIGFAAIDRNVYIRRHVSEFSNILYNPTPDNPKAIVYIDGSYAAINKSCNFRILRQSFCRYKGHHLVKPVLIVAPDGYILSIQGPYFSDARNNDARILENQFERNLEDMRGWFNEGDIFVVDRGYRDAIPLLNNLGIQYEMPAIVPRGQQQLSTEEANKSRLVTKTRWIVEARNGHLKSMFKFFDKTIEMPHVHNLSDLYQIAGALINSFHPPVSMRGANAQLAQELLRKSQEVNVVQARVEVDNLHLRNGQWVRMNGNLIPNFPRLTIEYLRDLTVGIYQVKLSPSYIQDKLQREENEEFQVDIFEEEPGFMRVRVFSRFRNATKYQLWIKYNDGEEPDEPNEPILGYFCTCKTGARTLGTCAHVASVLWYLGHARHDPNSRYPSSSLLNSVMDAANRPQQMVPDGALEIVG